MCSEREGKEDRPDRAVPALPPEMQAALDRFLREHRGVIEALARRT